MHDETAKLDSIPPQSTQSGRSLALGPVFFLIRDLFISVFLAVLVIVFIYQPVKVEGTSMMPSLVDQERIFVNKFLYRLGWGDIQRGDTIVFWYPGDTSKSYIKRVVGLPGDEISVRGGQVFVNRRALREDYVPDEYRSNDHMRPIRVPKDHFFVLGDHRNSSNDSRAWGPVPRSFIYGKAVFVYWPLSRLGPLR
jgi:signal peptidase I